MTMRSRREKVHFRHPFQIKGIDRLLPPGDYEVITDEEMIEGISFPWTTIPCNGTSTGIASLST